MRARLPRRDAHDTRARRVYSPAPVSTPRYRILAIDLDGTLVDHSGRVSDENVRALARARVGGLMPVLCTGRALIECVGVIERVAQTDPVIVSGGAMVACPTTHETLERFTLDLDLTRGVVSHLHARGHAALLLKDASAAGYDYLVVSPGGERDLDPASRTWFKHMSARVRFATSLDADEHPEHSVRVGAYAANTPVDELAFELRERFGGEAMLQHFSGVLMPAERREQGLHSVHIVELFHTSADKWKALERLARRMGVALAQTAAIGDQTNDLSMITHAGLGIAMGNADPRVKAAAGRITLSVNEHGLAHAIDRMLAGEW